MTTIYLIMIAFAVLTTASTLAFALMLRAEN